MTSSTRNEVNQDTYTVEVGAVKSHTSPRQMARAMRGPRIQVRGQLGSEGNETNVRSVQTVRASASETA